ncbi:hypothetical protein [Amycolatopsis sp. Hca4]|uniref:hypothetical protein n=1 Tax=Amycolatopsis sp. Hca4 TaxID=2742131 RepID=UPI0020CAEF3F|nr:hypothetical protein [Amycolatopsis sp. Hca4]
MPRADPVDVHDGVERGERVSRLQVRPLPGAVDLGEAAGHRAVAGNLPQVEQGEWFAGFGEQGVEAARFGAGGDVLVVDVGVAGWSFGRGRWLNTRPPS